MRIPATIFPAFALVLGVLAAPAQAEPAGEEAPDYKEGPGTERDEECLVCHAGIGEEEAPKLDLEVYRASIHAEEGCIGCHPGVEDPDIEHEKEDEDLPAPECETCHETSYDAVVDSIHRDEEAAKRAKDSDTELPQCWSCHGMHDIFPPQDPRAHVHPVNQLETCGECHDSKTEAAGHRLRVPEEYRDIVAQADPDTIQRLMDEGELLAAACADCHGAHSVWPVHVAQSSLHPTNINQTCGECHQDEVGAYENSVHAKAAEKEGFEWEVESLEESADEDVVEQPGAGAHHASGGHGDEHAEDASKTENAQPPTCATCHSMHSGAPPSSDRFHLDLVYECGTCHASLMETYQQSYHGKATILGEASVAQCSDCHGYHEILPPDDPESTVAPGENRLEMCRECHPKAPPKFASYMPHADPHDAETYPVLFWVYTFMTTLLVSVFLFFGLHTLLWGIREAADAIRERRPLPKHTHRGTSIERFKTSDRIIHLFVIISFLGLAATGAPLKFAQASWAKTVLDAMGGVIMAGWIHRILGVVTFGYFFAHIIQLAIRLWPRIVDGSIVKLLLGPESLVPSLDDIKDVFANFRYFLGLGPRPTFDRWTYWEKFDYWAVFWGVAIIGSSGLILWFPSFFTHVLPGWLINVAIIVHSDEALLAMGFIFGVHFFNSHLRRSKFPMDEVIFTGTVPLEEYKDERGRQWARLEANDQIHEKQGAAPSAAFRAVARVFGISAWLFGLILLGFIIHGFVTTH